LSTSTKLSAAAWPTVPSESATEKCSELLAAERSGVRRQQAGGQSLDSPLSSVVWSMAIVPAASWPMTFLASANALAESGDR